MFSMCTRSHYNNNKNIHFLVFSLDYNTKQSLLGLLLYQSTCLGSLFELNSILKGFFVRSQSAFVI